MKTGTVDNFLSSKWHIIKWFILPVWTAVLPIGAIALVSLLLPGEYFASLSILVITLNVIGYSFRLVKSGQPTRQARKRARIDKLHKKRVAMIHTVEPSLFTLEHSTLRKEELEGHTYVDQTQHWWVAIRLFFNPFVERPPVYASTVDKFVVLALKFLAVTFKVLWTLALLWVIIAGIATAYLPDLELRFIESLSIWLLWTVLWGAVAIKVWRGKRHVVTDQDLMVIINRQPFEDYKPARVPIEGIQSVTPVQSLAGKAFGFYTLEVDAKGNDDPAVSVLNYVRDGERVNQNIQFLMKQAKNTGYAEQ